MKRTNTFDETAKNGHLLRRDRQRGRAGNGLSGVAGERVDNRHGRGRGDARPAPPEMLFPPPALGVGQPALQQGLERQVVGTRGCHSGGSLRHGRSQDVPGVTDPVRAGRGVLTKNVTVHRPAGKWPTVAVGSAFRLPPRRFVSPDGATRETNFLAPSATPPLPCGSSFPHPSDTPRRPGSPGRAPPLGQPTRPVHRCLVPTSR